MATDFVVSAPTQNDDETELYTITNVATKIEKCILLRMGFKNVNFSPSSFFDSLALQ